MLQFVPLQAGIVLLVGLLFALGLLALWLYVTYWVYTDATDRGMDPAALWALVTFLVGPLGAGIYLVVREE